MMQHLVGILGNSSSLHNCRKTLSFAHQQLIAVQGRNDMDRSHQRATYAKSHSANVRQSSEDVRLSKSLSWILRHGATEAGFTFHDGGFLDVQDILSHRTFSRSSVNDVSRVVENNDKQRFALRTCPKSGKLQIRANQGHSLTVDNLELTPIVDPTAVRAAIHGTTRRSWEKIKNEGLSRMNRNHIHFSANEPRSGATSGIRYSSEVLIYVDLERAIKDGLKFFLSKNDVILSPGNEAGTIAPKYFLNVKFIAKNVS